MAKNQENNATILLCLKGYQVGAVKEVSKWVMDEATRMEQDVRQKDIDPQEVVLDSWAQT